MDEFLRNLRNLFGWGERPAEVKGRKITEGEEGQRPDVSGRFPSIFDNATPSTFNIRIDPKVADEARRTDLYAEPNADYLDSILAMNADELKSLLGDYHDANSWETREQAAERIRRRANQLDPSQRSTALNNWLDYFNGGHNNIMTGRGNVNFDYFTGELNRVLDDAKNKFIRRT